MKTSFSNQFIEAGCDEAGRGCLAGPVFAAAVILPENFEHPLIIDSKKLPEKKRIEAREIIFNNAVAWAVEKIDACIIDEINILNASFLGMSNAVKHLNVEPQLILVDGNRFKTSLKIPFQCIVKGDSIYTSIAAASILAKTFRDEFMMKIHDEFPEYNWAKNKGYPTKDHQNALLKYGQSIYHRKSFHLKSQLNLFND